MRNIEAKYNLITYTKGFFVVSIFSFDFLIRSLALFFCV